MQIRLDLAKHFAAGFVISIIGALLLNPVAGICAAIVVGAAKEWVWDAWLGKGTPDMKDFYATGLGAVPMLLGYGIWWLMDAYGSGVFQ